MMILYFVSKNEIFSLLGNPRWTLLCPNSVTLILEDFLFFHLNIEIQENTQTGIHTSEPLYPLKPVTTHTVRQLSAAQLRTPDAIAGLEEGLKCCEHNSPTPLRTQANHCGDAECWQQLDHTAVILDPNPVAMTGSALAKSCLIRGRHMITWWMKVQKGQKSELARSDDVYTYTGWHFTTASF